MQLTGKTEKKPKDLQEELDKEMVTLTDRLHGIIDPDSEEYTQILENLKILSEVQSTHAKTKKIGSDTRFNGFVALAQVGIIIIYENRHVFVTAAKQFLRRV